MRVSAAILCGTSVFLATALSGCSDSDNVTLYKPGVYKGAVDPLIEKQRSPAQQEKLLARFNQIQTDR
jgi:outer membrane protein assembly factor BamE (lipoprotein component of BamABCDE complex)